MTNEQLQMTFNCQTSSGIKFSAHVENQKALRGALVKSIGPKSDLFASEPLVGKAMFGYLLSLVKSN